MLTAIDANTGKIVWSVKNGDDSSGGKGESGTSAPMVVQDKVVLVDNILQRESWPWCRD